MFPVGIWAALSHAFSVLAMGAGQDFTECNECVCSFCNINTGAVSFGQIVKAGEPVFAAATNALLLRDVDHPMVYAALLPIIGGVGLASLKELSFTWVALLAALASNQAAAFKNVVSKGAFSSNCAVSCMNTCVGVMGQPWAKSLGPQNTYSVVTILALVATLPLVAIFDAKVCLCDCML